MSGPGAAGALRNTRVLELRGLGPGPFCGMLLADMGADVLRVDRTGEVGTPAGRADCEDPYGRNKRSIAIDLKKPEGIAAILRLITVSDALIDPFRPGVMERLGIGPEVCLAYNPRLVYGRMTGWGQTGPLAHTAGRDLNYIALSGALHCIGRAGQRPVPPLNLVGDLGGGAMYLAFGIVCGLFEVRETGRGQIIDAAMIDGAASLMTGIFGYLNSGRWSRDRANNFLDGGAPFYDTYVTKDGKFVAVAAIDPLSYAELLARLAIAPDLLPPQMQRDGWQRIRTQFDRTFLTKTRDEWCEIFRNSDACFAPVLDLDEAPGHPQNQARGTFVNFAGVLQASPAPRFSLTPASLRRSPPEAGQDSREVLTEWGLDDAAMEQAFAEGAIRQSDSP